jgi:thiamine-monophosphate kinase
VPLPERKLILGIRRQARPLQLRKRSKGAVVAGIGDDCAVLRIPENHDTLVTTDFSLEGVHFRREWHPPESVGHRCLTRGLSDIAAMGGEPRAAFLSLAVPRELPQKWVDGLLAGLLKLAGQFNVSLAGGDTSESPNGVLADIVVIGSAPKGKAILRSGAKPGDRIYVTGELGGSAAALDLLFSGQRLSPKSFSSHFFPIPRINVGRTLRERRSATAMIDISDGLSTDLAHICEESGVGAQIFSEALPRAIINRRKVDPQFALHGGEAYELLFTSGRKTSVPKRIAGVPITCIGQITEQKELALVLADSSSSELKPSGWQHFQQ